MSRLLCPWDSPGKNTGVGCHFLSTGDLSCPGIKPAVLALAGGFFTIEPSGKPEIKFWGVCVSRSVVSDSLQSARLLCPWNSPSKNTGVGSSSPSPGDLPDPGIEPRSPALQVDSLQSEPPGKPSSVLVFPNHSHTQ